MSRILTFFTGLVSLFAALWIVVSAGLPQRADYTGETITGLGHVAPEMGYFAPPFTADTLSGEPFNLLDASGESLVLNFWATWCIPCRTEMPELQALHESGQARIIGINVGETPEQIAAWVTEYQLSFEIVLDPQQTITHQYRILGQPSTFLVSPDGIITHIYYGAVTLDTLQSALSTH